MVKFWTDIEVAVLLIPGHKQSANCTCISISCLDRGFLLNPGSQRLSNNQEALALTLTLIYLYCQCWRRLMTPALRGAGLLNWHWKYSCTFTMLSWKHGDLWSLIVTSKAQQTQDSQVLVWFNHRTSPLWYFLISVCFNCQEIKWQ